MVTARLPGSTHKPATARQVSLAAVQAHAYSCRPRIILRQAAEAILGPRLEDPARADAKARQLRRLQRGVAPGVRCEKATRREDEGGFVDATGNAGHADAQVDAIPPSLFWESDVGKWYVVPLTKLTIGSKPPAIS